MTANQPSAPAALWEAALNLVYPPVCRVCGEERAGAVEGYVGPKCRRRVRPLTEPFCGRCGMPFAGEAAQPFDCENCKDRPLHFRFARSAVVSGEVILSVIHHYKYSHGLWFEPFLADLLTDCALPALRSEPWDLIVPVPLHAAREREREFNQAARLARRLSASSGIPLRTDLLRRVKATETQTQLNRGQRAENMEGAFRPGPGAKLNGEKVVVIDDVLTTGATTSACAGVLRALGAADVCVWTVARGA